VAGLQIRLKELVRGDRPVGDVCLGHVCPLLKLPEVTRSRRDQGDGDALSRSGRSARPRLRPPVRRLADLMSSRRSVYSLQHAVPAVNHCLFSSFILLILLPFAITIHVKPQRCNEGVRSFFCLKSSLSL
jgi:hypothetical protein